MEDVAKTERRKWDWQWERELLQPAGGAEGEDGAAAFVILDFRFWILDCRMKDQRALLESKI